MIEPCRAFALGTAFVFVGELLADGISMLANSLEISALTLPTVNLYYP